MEHELRSLKKTVSEKDKRIESLEKELRRWRELEAVLAEKDEFIDRLNEELKELREREKGLMTLVSENKRRIKEMEGEIERVKKSESRVRDTLAAKMREFDSVEFELQETKIEMATLYEKIGSLESLYEHDDSGDEASDLKAELRSAREAEKKALSQLEAMQEEMDLLKHEQKQALDGEQKSTKAMDDLALALVEVAAEAKQAKEKLATAESELERANEKVELLKGLLEGARHEAEVQRDTADRLRLEVEETMLGWNAKELGFVSCIRRAEEEKAAAMHENARLAESLKAAENMTRAAREEAYKSRDLLKQALSEANAAKAAAGVVQGENSQLKDSLTEKEETLHFLTREIERLRINEAAAQETIKQLKRMLSASSSTKIRINDKDSNYAPSESDSSDEDNDHSDDHHEVKNKGKDEDRNSREGFTLNLHELKVLTEQEDFKLKNLDEDPEKAEALKGSIFDTNAETPRSEPHTPKREMSKPRQRRYSFSYSEIQERPNSEETFFSSEYDDSAANNKWQPKGVKTMFRRVGGLLAIKKGLTHRKDSQLPSPSRSQSSTE